MLFDIPSLMFYVFSAVLMLSAGAVITAKNPVHSVFFLILAFFNAAGLFVLLGAEYLAMTLVIVYVGAVAVLFLFVVMMLNINFEKFRAGFIRYLPLGVFFAAFLFIELGALLYQSLITPAPVAAVSV
ncbi:MAG: NADH-quinone oxidoreductase subunit J, partial [Azospirillum brasilense]